MILYLPTWFVLLVKMHGHDKLCEQKKKIGVFRLNDFAAEIHKLEKGI